MKMVASLPAIIGNQMTHLHLQNQKAEATDLFKITEMARGSAENTATNVKEYHLCKNSFRARFHALSPQILRHNIKFFPVFA